MNQRSSSTFITPLRLGVLIAWMCLAGTACKKSGEATSSDFLTVMNVGKSQYERGDFAAAVATFEKAVQQQPTSIDARLNLANALLAADQPEQVFEQTRQVLAMDPQSGAAHYLAGCAHLRQSRFEEAVKSLQQAKDIDKTVNEVSFQLGIAHEGLRQYEDAIAQWRETVQFGPEHPAAYYRLSQVLIRQGLSEEAQPMLEKHREVTAGRTIPNNLSFFEQCRYTQMRVPFVLEQPEEQGIDVKFVDVTAEWLPEAAKFSGPVGLIDFQRTGQPGLLVIEEGRQFRLLTFTNGQFQPAGTPVPASAGAGYTKVLVGDLDNDRYDDAIVLGTNRSHVLKLGAEGRITDRTLLTGLNELKAIDGELADLDFTSKLSLVVALPESQGIRFYRNLGNVMFKEDTAAIGLPTNAFAATQVTVADWNKDDLPDVLVMDGWTPQFFANQRGGPLTTNVLVSAGAAARFVAVHDVNNDLRPDLLSLSADRLQITHGGLTNGHAIPLGDEPVTSLVPLDYDNDGWLDLIGSGDSHLRIWRSLGERGLVEQSRNLGSFEIRARQVIATDLDNDCDLDFVVASAAGGLRLFRNDGGNQNHMVKIKAVGNRSNYSGIGARFEFTAGNWRGMRTVRQTPLEVGIGKREQIDSAFIQWTQLRMNVESISAAECRVSFIAEIEQTQMTSCPYLYVWDGRTFRFVSDFLSAAPVGLPVAPGRIIPADPEELLWMGDASMVPLKDGRLVIQMTEELSEVLYLDEVKLLAVDHPAGTEVFSTSKLLPGPPWLPHEIVTLHQPLPLVRATSNTRQPGVVEPPADAEAFDVTDRLRAIDGVRVSPEIFGDHLRGWAKTQEIVLDFGPLDAARPLALTLNGWLRFGGAMSNMAASQRDDLPFPFPTLAVESASGEWQPVDVRVGAPAGRTKSIVVDLAGKLPAGARRLKLAHAFEIHWDQIALFEKTTSDRTVVTRLRPSSSILEYRGFSENAKLDWTHPTTPVHEQLQAVPLVPKVPTGWVTRLGSVDELVADKDNALALVNGGDALTVSFDPAQLPDLPPEYERDFFVWSVGWEKDTDYHTLLGDRTGPWPWHGMDDQRYGEEARPSFPSDELMHRYTTRWSGATVPWRKDVAGH